MARRRRPPRAGALTELPPMRILAQIATLQAIYYCAATVLFLFTSLVSGSPFRFKMILGWDYMRGDTTQGWLLSFIWVIDGGFVMSLAIVALVARSKLVPDFAITIHGIHLVLVALATRSLPRTLTWWITMIASSAIATGLGIWGCQYRELQPVFFGGGGGGGGGGRSTGERRVARALSGGRAVGGRGREDDEDDHDDDIDDEDELGRGRTQEEYELQKLDSRAT